MKTGELLEIGNGKNQCSLKCLCCTGCTQWLHTWREIALSHGAIWLEEPLQIVSKYAQRADAYQEEQITIAYYVIWEDTAEIAHKIASEISKQSPETVVKIFNVAKADKNWVITEVFKSKAIAVGSSAVSSCESVKILQEKLKEAGFDVVDGNIKSLWIPIWLRFWENSCYCRSITSLTYISMFFRPITFKARFCLVEIRRKGTKLRPKPINTYWHLQALMIKTLLFLAF